jgi:hypothetical protein
MCNCTSGNDETKGGNRMTNLGATGKLRKVELRHAFAEHFVKEGA